MFLGMVTAHAIDGSLIRDITEDEMDCVFVEAIARAARRVGKRTIAEHVTSFEALSLLRDLGVDMAQAYLLGEPAPVAEAFAALRRSSSPPPTAALAS
jgi:EAL domain-containing protein (putative c-di-GMP-specific phosphodiesterase class I)